MKSRSLFAIVGMFAVMGMLYAVPYLGVSASTPTYSYSVSPGTQTSNGNWVISPGSGGVTYTATTTDTSVNKITISGTCAGSCSPTNSFIAHCSGSPILSCSTTPSVTYTAGDTWDLIITFYTGSGSHQVRAAIYPNITVTPEFPAGGILAILAPIGALIGYSKFGRSTIRKPV